MSTNIAFCGAGFLGIYHIGVVSCLKFYARELLDKIKCYGGCSAGALAACMLLCDVDMEECVKFVMNQASRVSKKLLGPFSSEFDPCTKIRISCQKSLPGNAYEIASGKLFISLTRVSDWTNVVVSEYANNEELIDALICTCFIPICCGLIPPRFQDVAYVDGGFTNNLPKQFEGTTITVSPFGGENDICPDDRHKSNSQFDLHNTNVQFSCHNLYRMTRALFPPNSNVLEKMCCEGFNDALKYLFRNYADMVSLDVEVKFPKFCKFALRKEDLDVEDGSLSDSSMFKDSENEFSAFSEVEQQIAVDSVLNEFALPQELQQILDNTRFLFEEDHLNWYVVRALTQILKWMAKPCNYSSKQILQLSRNVAKTVTPKLKWVSSYNYYTKRAVETISRGFHAYKDTAQYEWHPSIKEENQHDIEQKKERLKSAQRSLVVLPSRTSFDNVVKKYDSDYSFKNCIKVCSNSDYTSEKKSENLEIQDEISFIDNQWCGDANSNCLSCSEEKKQIISIDIAEEVKLFTLGNLKMESIDRQYLHDEDGSDFNFPNNMDEGQNYDTQNVIESTQSDSENVMKKSMIDFDEHQSYSSSEISLNFVDSDEDITETASWGIPTFSMIEITQKVLGSILTKGCNYFSS